MIHENRSKRMWGFIQVIIISIALLSGCGGSDSDGNTDDAKRVPRMIFGANMAWERLGDGAMEGGDLLRDRSFRGMGDAAILDYWGELPDGGTITWNTVADGDTNPAGGKGYPGYVELSRSSAGLTGILQQIMGGVSNGNSYTMNFSSYGVGGTATVEVHLYDSSWSSISSKTVSAADGAWTRHSISLSPSADESLPVIGIYIRDTGIVRIDEVRLAEAGSELSVRESLKSRIANLGITSLRWPGGTLADDFFWRESVGSRITRGEMKAYDRYETPALGLHEFLNLCGELDVVPLITVNVFDTPQSAADLVEYVLGSSSTTQGAIRAANGRVQPWIVSHFEIGNEPAVSYKGAGATENAGSNYAALARAILSAMKGKAALLGREILVSGISEPNFQLADWVVSSSLNEVVRLIYNWNSQVFDPVSGIGDVDIIHGHYYSYRDCHDAEPDRFRHLMSAGTVLKRNIEEKIEPIAQGHPLWISEYHVVLEKTGVIQAEYTMDFQSGLAVADMLMAMINSGVEAAHVWCLAQYGAFGIMSTPDMWPLRPAGLVFRLLSAAAGERILNASVDDPGSYVISASVGNIPSGLSYELVSVLATENGVTGRPRIFLINRDYDTPREVTVEVDGLGAGSAVLYRYENADLAANNEADPDMVTVAQETVEIGSPLVITLEPHSLYRIDVE